VEEASLEKSGFPFHHRVIYSLCKLKELKAHFPRGVVC
jgi:hypothetical protein